MKIGVWIDKDISPNHGGGFSYTSKLVRLIDERHFNDDLEICFVSFDPICVPLKKEVIQIIKHYKKLPFPDSFILNLTSRFYSLRKITNRLLEKENKVFNDNLIIQLNKNKVEVLYYLGQMISYVPGFPFVSTNWDLGHLTLPPFPEVAEKVELKKRNRWYNSTLKSAVAIFSESETGKMEIVQLLNINANKINVVPLFPGDIIGLDITEMEQIEILNHFKIDNKHYFFYPAQFWEHKNHSNLVLAFHQFLREYPEIKLVFSGSDKGFLDSILSQVIDLNIEKSVFHLGFVSDEELFALYKNTIALVMPTFLGPTNIPLLEARSLGCPVLCSDFIGHREQLGKGALYFNPHDFKDILFSLLKIMDTDVRSGILREAKYEETISIFNSETAVEKIEKYFVRLNEQAII
jgi:glycosyltransferase involved in cell wall biosynthesis